MVEPPEAATAVFCCAALWKLTTLLISDLYRSAAVANLFCKSFDSERALNGLPCGWPLSNSLPTCADAGAVLEIYPTACVIFDASAPFLFFPLICSSLYGLWFNRRVRFYVFLKFDKFVICPVRALSMLWLFFCWPPL